VPGNRHWGNRQREAFTLVQLGCILNSTVFQKTLASFCGGRPCPVKGKESEVYQRAAPSYARALVRREFLRDEKNVFLGAFYGINLQNGQRIKNKPRFKRNRTSFGV